MSVVVIPQERSWTVAVDRPFAHAFNGCNLMSTEGEQEDSSRSEDRPETDCYPHGWRVVTPEPFAVRLHGYWFELDEPTHRIRLAPRLIEAQVPILAEAEDDDIESTQRRDAGFVL